MAPDTSTASDADAQAALADIERLGGQLRAARAARVVLDLALEAAQIGNPTVTSDAAVAAWAACAAIRASAINVRVNLPGVRDPAFAERCESELGALVRDAIALAEEVERVSGRPT